MTTRVALDAALLQAHSDNDFQALVALYAQAADLAQSDGDTEAMCFYLTHAYVFALEAGLPIAAELRARLVEYGSETPD